MYIYPKNRLMNQRKLAIGMEGGGGVISQNVLALN